MAKELNLPELEAYTKEQLAKKWECDISLVKGYIDSGQLKEALPPTAMRNLRRWSFYRCEENEPLSGKFSTIEVEVGSSKEWLLDLIEDGEMLEEYVGRLKQEKIVSCPKHLYLAVEDNASIKRSDKDYNMVRYFYDLDGNALIPIEYEEDGHQICFAPIKKEHLDSSIIRIEEVKRFRSEINIEQTEQEQKNSKIASSKTNDNISLRKPPPIDDIYLDIKEVSARVGFKPPTIRKKIKEGKFPPMKKFGKSARWHKSVIDLWIQGKWEKENDKKSNE